MPVYRKIYKQGHSSVITIPAWAMDQLGVKDGDYFLFKVNAEHGIFLMPVTEEDYRADRWSNKGIDRKEKVLPPDS